MTVQTKATLKGYFNTHDLPNEANFADPVDSIGPRFGLYVAANNASDASKAQADYVCDNTADDVQIQAALDALPAAGGQVVLSEGTFTTAAAVAIAAKKHLRGLGIGATGLAGTVGSTAGLATLVNSGGLEKMSITIPAACTADAIIMQGVDTANLMSYLRDLFITGGGSATQFGISINDMLNFRLANIRMQVNCNGVRCLNTHNEYNYGNADISAVEVQLGTAGRIGWDFDGTAGDHNFNLMVMNYISAVTGSGAGSTGVRIQNCAFLTFNNLDIEGCATALDIQGGVSGGAAAQCNTFINPYFNVTGDVTLGANALNTVFVGGRIYGTITDSCVTANRTTQYYGTAGPTGARIV